MIAATSFGTPVLPCMLPRPSSDSRQHGLPRQPGYAARGSAQRCFKAAGKVFGCFPVGGKERHRPFARRHPAATGTGNESLPAGKPSPL